MNPSVHFVAGLPRSGSTLLCNILAQNPRFGVTPTSGLPEVLRGIRDGWNNVEAFRANPNPEARDGLMRGAFYGFFEHLERPVVFDKSRAWPAYIEMAEHLMQREMRIIATVRDVRDVLASFERLYRQTIATDAPPLQPTEQKPRMLLEDRLEAWASHGGPVGSAYNVLKDALDRGLGDRILFVDFDELTRDPAAQMYRVYTHLGEEPFVHDFDNVEQVISEDDAVYGYVGLHDIRTKVEPVPSRFEEVLGDKAKKYANLEFWR